MEEVIVDPMCDSVRFARDTRVRFEMAGEHIDVYLDEYGSLIVHAAGWDGRLTVRPRVTNEIEVTLEKRVSK
jgi:hypothetical protein